MDRGLAEAPSRARIWWDAARPKTLGAAVAPVVLGVGLALEMGTFHALSATCALAGAILIQIGTNFVNDSEDAVRGADTDARRGPTRATASGAVSVGAMRAAAAVTFALAVVRSG